MTSQTPRRFYARKELLRIRVLASRTTISRKARRALWFHRVLRPSERRPCKSSLIDLGPGRKHARGDGLTVRCDQDFHRQGPVGANPRPRAPNLTEPRTTTPRPPPPTALPNKVNIGTLNACTLKADWRLKECVAFMRAQQLDILCIIKTRRREDTDVVEDGYILISYPANSAGVGGIGFLFSPIVWPHVLNLELDPRISTATMRLTDRCLVLACVYAPTAPTTEANPTSTDAFY